MSNKGKIFCEKMFPLPFIKIIFCFSSALLGNVLPDYILVSESLELVCSDYNFLMLADMP